MAKSRQQQYNERNVEKHRATMRGYAARFRAHVREVIRARKGNTCQDCGGEFPHYVLDFDHVRGEKLFGISEFVYIGAYNRLHLLEEEMDKCEVVCANCHRIREYERSLEQVEAL